MTHKERLIRFAAIGFVWFIVNTPSPSAAVGPLKYGLAVGNPQTLALTVEAPVNPSVIVQSSLGTVLLFSSASLRAIFMNDAHRAKPYLFAGAGLFHTMGTDTGVAAGSTDFFWFGGGLRFADAGSHFYAEIGVLTGMDTDNGYSRTRTAGAVGIAF